MKRRSLNAWLEPTRRSIVRIDAARLWHCRSSLGMRFSPSIWQSFVVLPPAFKGYHVTSCNDNKKQRVLMRALCPNLSHLLHLRSRHIAGVSG